MTPTTFIAAAGSSDQNEWLWGFGSIPALLLFIFWVVALVSIIRSHYHWSMKVLAIVGTFGFPFLGPLLWFLSGRKHDGAWDEGAHGMRV